MNLKDEKFDCCIVGDAMIDVIFPLKDKSDLDCIRCGGTITSNSQFCIGGTANVAINLSALDLKTAFIGTVGMDVFGEYYSQKLKLMNVHPELRTCDHRNTGVAFTVILPDKERFFLVDRGANDCLTIGEQVLSLCSRSGYLYISGYLLQSEQGYQEVLKLIHNVNSNTKIVFNPGSPNIIQNHLKYFSEILRNHVDILVLNEIEGEVLGITDTSIQEVDFIETIALTKGKFGSTIKHNHSITDVKPFPATKIVNSSGAGDAFAAGLIYGLLHHWRIEDSGHFASRVAASVVESTNPNLIYSGSKFL